jgi:hypothetical protein
MSLQYINISSGTETYKSTYIKINNNLSEQFVSGFYNNETLTLNRFDGTTYNITGFTSSNSSGITSIDVTNALGFIPYDSTNPNLYIDFISGDTRYYLNTNPSNYISSITSNNVTTALGYVPLSAMTLTGDINGSGFNSVVTTLASITTGATVGSSTQVPVITYDSKGRITSASTTTINTKLKFNISGATITLGNNPNIDYYYFCLGNNSLTLPSAINNNCLYTIHVTNGNTTIYSNETINDSSSITINTSYTSRVLISNDTKYVII